MSFAPIALFVYNRPQHTELTVKALRNNHHAEAADLYIFSDAAKNESAEAGVTLVRSYIKSINGFKSVTIIERDKNWGLANSVIDGVTKLCDQFGKIIVLEDDLETSPYFLDYMNRALIQYENESRVMQISAHMFDVDVPCKEDAFFLPFTTSWGWATWASRWSDFDAKAETYNTLKLDTDSIKRFNLNDSYPYFKMLESQMQGKIDSWAIRWNLTVFMLDGLVLFPKKSLIKNNGFDGSGVHCEANGLGQKSLDLYEINNLPSSIKVMNEYKNLVFDYLKMSNRVGYSFFIFSILKRLINKIKVVMK